MFDLSGKTALVTGASGGIGGAIARTLKARGAKLALSGTREEALRALADELGGAEVLPCRLDVAEEVEALVPSAVEKLGQLDILVNNAAVNKADNFATTTDRSWDWVVDTNVNSLFAVTKPIYKQMIRRRSGTILNITSIGAIRALPTAVHYATSKAAMIGFTKCLSREAANFGITVNAIAAGIFDTDLGNTLPARLLEAHENWVSLRRLGRPEELAEFAAFIVSPRNSYMNGEIITVDGGTIT